MDPSIPDFTRADAFDDPWESYRWLRDNDPVHWHEEAQAWFVSRHPEVSHISRHPELYCSKQGVRHRNGAPASILTMDDPEHQRQRSIINRGFTPRQVRRLIPHIQALTDQLITSIQDRGEIDFVADFAVHVPLIVIAELLGLDPGMRASLLRWSDAISLGEGRAPEDPLAQQSATAAIEYYQYALKLIDERRAEPREDLVSILTGAFDEGTLDTTSGTDIEQNRGLPADDLFMFLLVLLVAGNDTTRNTISGGLHAFSRFSDQRERLLAEPWLIDRAVEEILRFVSPVMGFGRTVTTDHELCGEQLKQGDFVLMLYQSANRDERVFDAPEEFRIDRHPNPHLTFGLGPHFCLGANLARAELKIVFEELFRRLSDIRVPEGVEPTRAQNALLLTIERLPAIFTPISS
jgi:cytochrome P450 family 142 subfamily A polypeptide 1